VEARNFDIRKNLLKFDDVTNDQRKAIFSQRREVMEATDLSDTVEEMRHSLVDDMVAAAMPERAYADQWDIDGLDSQIREVFALELPVHDWAAEEGADDETMRERLVKAVDEQAAKRVAKNGVDRTRQAEKAVLLEEIDSAWREHLTQLDHLRSVVGLRGYAQRDPLNEYKSEAFELFDHLMNSLRRDVTLRLSHNQLPPDPSDLSAGIPPELLAAMQASQAPAEPEGELVGASAEAPADARAPEDARGGEPLRQPVAEVDPADQSTWGKVRRNDACPCGSGKKFKQCHGKV
ncbi:MAG: SEC-C metal-binding domain-containing protein, partial [Pikeienuella sp.]